MAIEMRSGAISPDDHPARPEVERTSRAADVGSVKVSVVDVERSFGRGNKTVSALGPMSLDIEEGEFVCLLGPSGCGKSTLLRIVAGLINPSVGEILINRKSTSVNPVAMVFQDHSIFPWKSVRSNIELGLVLRGSSKKAAHEAADYWIDRMGLTNFGSAYPAVLSGGMRQRVAIARALVVEPEILLMDEPFAALDAQLRALMQEELLQLWEADRHTVVFVTHSIEEAILLGDRIILMSSRPGKVLQEYRVPFERPRSGSLRGDPDFARLQDEIWEQLRTEVNKTLGGVSEADNESGEPENDRS